ncbi:MAG TPA: FAD binding domain-containing protein [Gaiellaceae bacterium]|nr:FAD binding domain-containing protein [Gaiellaceae bacterium]
MAVSAHRAPEVIRPGSLRELVESFGDGADTVVLGGGTVLVPDLAHRHVRPRRVLLLPPELSGVSRADGNVTIGAATRVSELEAADEPLATAARHLADREVRAQATVGGNLCVRGGETPRGDLQAPLLVLGARVRTAGPGGERSMPLEDFLASGPNGRVVLDVAYDDAPRQTGYAAVLRPHTHHYTILAVAAARRDGETRVAVTGAAPTAVRLPSVEAGGSPEDALNDVDPPDDALASAWYRSRVLPTLVGRALSSLQ